MNDLSNFNENFWNVTYDNIKGHKKHCFTHGSQINPQSN